MTQFFFGDYFRHRNKKKPCENQSCFTRVERHFTEVWFAFFIPNSLAENIDSFFQSWWIKIICAVDINKFITISIKTSVWQPVFRLWYFCCRWFCWISLDLIFIPWQRALTPPKNLSTWQSIYLLQDTA